MHDYVSDFLYQVETFKRQGRRLGKRRRFPVLTLPEQQFLQAKWQGAIDRVRRDQDGLRGYDARSVIDAWTIGTMGIRDGRLKDSSDFWMLAMRVAIHLNVEQGIPTDWDLFTGAFKETTADWGRALDPRTKAGKPWAWIAIGSLTLLGATIAVDRLRKR